MKKTNYRVTLLKGHDRSFCTPLIMAAAESNGSETPFTLEKIKSFGDAQILLYPSLNPDVSIEIIGDTLLHVDRKIGDDYVTTCVIEMVEVFELKPIEEQLIN